MSEDLNQAAEQSAADLTDILQQEPSAAESGPENVPVDGNAAVGDEGAGPTGKSGDEDSTEAAEAQQPISAESTPNQEAGPQGQSGEVGSSEPERDVIQNPWTMEELLKEYFPGAKRFSGGVAAGLQRELRRRNRKAEKGY